MKREYLEFDGKPFIPSWAIKEWGEKQWDQIKTELQKTHRFYYANELHGFLYWRKDCQTGNNYIK